MTIAENFNGGIIMAKQKLIQEAIKIAKEVGACGQPTVNAFTACLHYMEHCKDEQSTNEQINLINKVCDWLSDHLMEYVDLDAFDNEYIDYEKLTKTLKDWLNEQNNQI